MSDSEQYSDTETPQNNTTTSNPSPFPPELAAQFAEFLRQSLKSAPINQPERTHHPESLGDIIVKTKLDGDNYPLWSNVMSRAIGGKGLTSHIDGVSVPPPRTDPDYQHWQQRDHCVFTWILNNISADLVNEVSQYATAKELWDALAITYGSGADPVQVYDLHRQTNTLKQEDMSLENLWTRMQNLWISIDRRETTPMTKERLRLYQFVTALDDKYESIKKEIIRMDPLPTAREAYARVRRESVNSQIKGIGSSDPQPAGIGSGLTASAPNRNQSRAPNSSQPPSRPWQKRTEEDKSRLVCSHCGGKKHTKEGCFLLIGFPEWWDEMKRARAARATANRGGRVATVVGDRPTDAGNPTGSSGATHGSTGESRGEGDDAKCAAARVFTSTGTNLGINPHSYNLLYFDPKSLHKSHLLPRPTTLSQIRPTTSPIFQKPTPKPNILSNQPQKNHKLQLPPQKSNISENSPHQDPKSKLPTIDLSHVPNISHKNSFQALANSSVTSILDRDDNWIFDCGATDTMSFAASDFTHISKAKKSCVRTANGHLIPVAGAGTIKLSPTLQLSNCLYVPSLAHKLVSVSHVTRELHCNLLMQPTFCALQDIKTGMMIGHGTERQGLYYVDRVAQHGNAMLTHGPTNSQAWIWHRRLGHPSIGYLHLLFPKLTTNLQFLNCETCFLAKRRRHSFKFSNTREKVPFSIVHSDVWGPAPVVGGQGFKYFVLFIDDCTRMTWVYFLKSKSDVFEKFRLFYTLVQTQYNRTIKILRSDNGGEFVNSNMQHFFSERGIIHQTTCPHTPEQNGVAERKNRTLLEMTRALVIESKVPKTFWPEALATSVYLINRLPTRILNFATPLDTFSSHHQIPPPLNLEPRVFGCSVFVHIPKHERSKLSPRSVKCVFLGYGTNQKGYRCYDPQTTRLHITMNCDFVESEYYYTQLRGQGEESDHIPLNDPLSCLPPQIVTPDQTGLPNFDPVTNVGPPDDANCSTTGPVPESHTQPEELSVNTTPSSPPVIPMVRSNDNDNVETNDLRQDTDISDEPTETSGNEMRGFTLPPRRNRGVPPKRYSPEWKGRKTQYSIVNTAQSHLTEMARAFEAALYEEEDIPGSWIEAMKHKHWREAMEKEMNALIRNRTWEECDLPEGKKPVGCRWIFTIKRRADGSIERYKARLVAKGYTQTYGVDYEETFSPVAMMKTVRTLLAVAASKDWPLHQFDVTNAFLHGELKENEEVYMEMPSGYTGGKPVCRLRKTLYGLKQSPRVWFGRFSQAMLKYGYVQSLSDHTLFLKKRGGKTTCLLIYVDDMIITGDDEEEISTLQANLFQEFEMKDLRSLKYFLGIEVLRSKQGIFLRQKKYVLDLLAEIGLLDCKPADIPMMVNHGLKFEEGAKLANREEYQRLVGKLIYLSHTRPDIAYAVGVVSQFMHRPQENHLDAALRIVRYLKRTTGYGVLLRKSEDLEIDGYTDADWASNPIDRKSTGGYFTFVGGNLVTWRSKKQKVVALSSAEAEFRGIKSGLTEIGCPLTRKSQLFCDNKAAISISENPVQHDRTKHVEVDRHFIKEKIEGGIIELPFVRSEDQLADILTKAVNPKFFSNVLDKLSIGDAVAQLEGECQRYQREDLPKEEEEIREKIGD